MTIAESPALSSVGGGRADARATVLLPQRKRSVPPATARRLRGWSTAYVVAAAIALLTALLAPERMPSARSLPVCRSQAVGCWPRTPLARDRRLRLPAARHLPVVGDRDRRAPTGRVDRGRSVGGGPRRRGTIAVRARGGRRRIACGRPHGVRDAPRPPRTPAPRRRRAERRTRAHLVPDQRGAHERAHRAGRAHRGRPAVPAPRPRSRTAPLDRFDGFVRYDQYREAALRYQVYLLGYALSMSQYTARLRSRATSPRRNATRSRRHSIGGCGATGRRRTRGAG